VGIDWSRVSNPSSAVNLSGTTVNLVNTLTTYTGNTPQTGDSFVRLGAPVNASISADIAEVEAETDGIAAIPTNPLLTTDLRLNDLDAPVSGVPAAVLAAVVEAAAGAAPQFAVQDVLKQVLAMCAGKTTNMGTANGHVTNPAGTKNRVTADTSDPSNNRTPSGWDNS
jgi:hypothetical protein